MPKISTKNSQKLIRNKSNERYDGTIDLYALFVIFFKMATGKFPIEAANYTELRAKMDSAHQEKKDPRDHPLLENFPLDFRNFLSLLGHPDPKKRGNIQDLLQKNPFLTNHDQVTVPCKPPVLATTSSESSIFFRISQALPSSRLVAI